MPNSLHFTSANSPRLGPLDENSTIKFVDEILLTALNKKASDIHCEPYHQNARIRLRIDGLLYDLTQVELKIWPNLSARLKVLANLNIAEKRLPQDGRFSIQHDNSRYDCRISSCPTLFGEKFAIRILNPANFMLDLNNLGLNTSELTLLQHYLNLPQGMLLVTGPTGSGKTVTLYSAITALNQQSRNISTVEDPIEFSVSGINQVEINPKIGLDFPLVLRTLLRQDPDIIVVGEMRDLETATIAVNAAHTGHLVLATLHTNSAAASLTRILNLGVPPLNLATSLKLIIAQRLVRKLCDRCKVPCLLSPSQLTEYGFPQHTQLYRPQGCTQCNHGYLGRTAIFEFLTLNEQLQYTIMQTSQVSTIEQKLQDLAYPKLKTKALAMVLAGQTSLEEVNRVILL